jgi:hypothetical protein
MKNRPLTRNPNTLAGAALVFVLVSCVPITKGDSDAPPYVVTSPVCVVGERTGYYQFIGIEFYFLNTSPKEISQITVSFRVFDAQTEKNPLVGSNLFELTLLGSIYADEKKEMIIPFDRDIYKAPSEPNLIDFFYVSEILYVDCSTWEDPYGTYHKGGY